MLSRDGERVISYSRVQDFVHRPVELTYWSLYDYLRFTEVKPMSDNEREDAYNYIHSLGTASRLPRPGLLFDAQHPNVCTHRVRLISVEAAKYLTWVGGMLPRNDAKSPREEYCRVMCTLFSRKGWRSGLELKTVSQTWTEAFEGEDFPPKAVLVMKHMHELYECNDARHDYAAQRRSGNSAELPPVFASSDNISLGDLDLESDMRHEIDSAENMDIDTLTSLIQESDANNARTRRVFQQISDMHKLIDRIPYTSMADPLRGDEPSVDIPHLPSSAWKNLLTEARQNIIRQRMSALQPVTNDSTNANGVNTSSEYRSGNVSVIDPQGLEVICRSYLDDDYSLYTPTELVKKVEHDFSLNEDQLRAFTRTVAHILYPADGPLRLYLGGMAGTGKSQVIKALIALFAARNETHRFMVMAPTGTAASLVDGMTYHSALYFSHNTKTVSRRTLDKIHAGLEHVDFFFIDEISMISCTDLCRISKRLGEAFDIKQPSFAGRHVILAGDFAQLPPVAGGALYMFNVGQNRGAITPSTEDASLGKAVWHEFVDVVILRENMRQLGVSRVDIAFRSMLENLRYGACTNDDIKLIKSRVLGTNLPVSIMDRAEFRNVSILTAINSHRDAINNRASVRYARDNEQQLTKFYSVDNWDTNSYLARCATAPAHVRNELIRRRQQVLWDTPPSLSGQIAGILPLCPGMPVMLKHNEATEVCATNGAEGRVVSWHASSGLYGKRSIDTLFVELVNPPRNIQVGNLPPNVVPVAATTKAVTFYIGEKNAPFKVSRKQVHVLLNFAMTVHASQGRTRPYNVVDLSECPNHQSIYTCLSRSSSLEGTVVLQDFDTSKFTSGTSGDLRQEFKELEILDWLTEMRINGTLPDNAPKHNRASIISWYLQWKKGWLMPPKAHKSLTDKNIIPRKRVAHTGLRDPHAIRKVVSAPRVRSVPTTSIFWLPWDSCDWSCCYDATIFILWGLMKQNVLTFQVAVSENYGPVGKHILSALLALQTTADASHFSLVNCRNQWRTMLSELYPTEFAR
ncbi:hypothetical protein NLI96_g7290 [Meripilus lineatus]|uniref:ATP-dependent DNA helicase n=1 Tax=Meripilus lineatus TaxID=2056292 RepID=A0AAD5UZB6_9APHY|nr:hypothetical protein NLI96_g7290 [Physisporinus lineatus]